MPQTNDMDPRQLRARFVESDATQAAIARQLGVSPSTVSQVVSGTTVSDRIRRAISSAINVPVERIWPSAYLRDGGPRKPGRPFTGTI